MLLICFSKEGAARLLAKNKIFNTTNIPKTLAKNLISIIRDGFRIRFAYRNIVFAAIDQLD